MVEIPEEWVDRVHSVLATRAVLTCRADVEAALSALPVAEMVEALQKIADEQKQYLGHGDYDILPACSADEAQRLAIKALSLFPSPSTEKAKT